MDDTPTVFIVDDDQELCAALRWLLESEGLRVELYHSGEEYLAAFDPRRPGVLVLDVRMDGMSGLELHKQLIERGFAIPVIFLTGHGDVPMAVDSIKAGAVDFLQKPVHDVTLIERINEAMRLDARRRRALEENKELLARFERLTPREWEVLGLVVEGRANKQIAAILHISEKTVEVHRKHVMSKLQAQSVAELVRMVITRDAVESRAR